MSDFFLRVINHLARPWRTLILAGLVMAFIFTYWLGSPTRSVVQTGEENDFDSDLVVSERDFDLGEVWEQKALRLKFTIKNQGDSDKIIESFASTCGCTSIEPPSLMIPAGKEGELHANINITFNERQDDKDFQVAITPVIRNEPDKRAPTWRFRGHATRLLKLAPLSVAFYDNSLIRGQNYPTRTVTASPVTTLDSISATCPVAPDAVEVEVVPSQDGNRFEIKITPAAALPLGPFRFDVLLEPMSKGQPLPIVKLPVEGRVLENVQSLPESLILGLRNIGETVTETITLRAVDGVPFDIAEFQTDSTDTTVEPASVPDISDKVFRITHKIAKVGKQEFSIRFNIMGNSEAVLVKGTYFGAQTSAVNKQGD